MTTTATARVTAGSLMGAITEAATTVTSVFSTTTKAINMANRYVSDAAEKQRIRSIVDMSDFEERLVRDKAQEDVLHKEQIAEFLSNGNEERTAMFEETMNRYKELLAK